MLGLGSKLTSTCLSHLVCSTGMRRGRRRSCKDVGAPRQFIAHPSVAHRVPPPCSLPPYVGAPEKPCFDISELLIERGCQKSNRQMASFIRNQYFPREPCLVGLYLSPDDPYLKALEHKYTHSGDRFFAYELDCKRNVKTLVGVCIASKKFPWEADRLEKWGQNFDLPAQYHALLQAHYFRAADLCYKYKVPYVYDIDVIATSQEMTGLGIADLLLRCAILAARELRFPIVQLAATNSYMINPCKRAGMKLEWTKKFTDFTNRDGKGVFCVRQPHESVNLFIRHITPVENLIPDSCKDRALYEAFQIMYVNKKRSIVRLKKPRCSMKPPPKTKCPPTDV